MCNSKICKNIAIKTVDTTLKNALTQRQYNSKNAMK